MRIIGQELRKELRARLIAIDREGIVLPDMLRWLAQIPTADEPGYLRDQIEQLAHFILAEIPGEPSQNEGAVDCAIRLLREAKARDDQSIDAAIDKAGAAAGDAAIRKDAGTPFSSPGGPAAHDEHGASCHDCNRPYGDEHGFPDLIIPYRVWKEITPTQDDGGLLCPSCICKRLHDRGISCEGAFMSGPIRSVSRAMMSALRGVENIELAIEGRDNRWAGVRELVTDNAPPDATKASP